MIDPRIFQVAQRLNALYPPELIANFTRLQEISRRFGGWQPAPKSEPVKPPWSRDADPNVPEAFKQLCRTLFGTEQQFLTMELSAEHYSIDMCVICEYHKLAKVNYQKGLGRVPQLLLWERVSAVHKKILRVEGPTNRRRVLNRLGLGSLPGPDRGRKPKTSRK